MTSGSGTSDKDQPHASPVRVLIIGAGPVGLTLANELVRRGVRTRVIDKAPAIREISKALIIHVRTQEALDKVGIMARAVAQAEPMREVVVHGYGKHIGSWHLDGINSAFPHPLILGQNRTQHLLNDALNSLGVEVEWNTEALELNLDDRGATLKLRHTGQDGASINDEVVDADYVIGCEGSRSLVRKALGLTFEGERYGGEQFIQADCKLVWNMPSGRSYLFLTTDGYMMAIEMPNGLVRIFISIPDTVGTAHPSPGQRESETSLGAAEDISSEPTLEEIKGHFERLSGLQVTLSEPVWLARYRTSHRYANNFGGNRAFVAGDSGHVHVPIGGQGMNTGIQDAFNLGWKLAGVIQGHYERSLLETYNQERHPVAEGLIKGTDLAYRSILHPSEVKQRAVRLLGPFVMRTDLAQSFVRNTLEELSISYPRSALTEDHGGGGGPKPGERCPDAFVVLDSDKRTVRISDLTRGVEWTLLLFTGTWQAPHGEGFSRLIAEVGDHCAGLVTAHVVVAGQPAAADYAPGTSVLVDALHGAHDTFGVAAPMIYLIRPDNCIGFRGPPRIGGALLGYLERVFKPQRPQ